MGFSGFAELAGRSHEIVKSRVHPTDNGFDSRTFSRYLTPSLSRSLSLSCSLALSLSRSLSLSLPGYPTIPGFANCEILTVDWTHILRGTTILMYAQVDVDSLLYFPILGCVPKSRTLVEISISLATYAIWCVCICVSVCVCFVNTVSLYRSKCTCVFVCEGVRVFVCVCVVATRNFCACA